MLKSRIQIHDQITKFVKFKKTFMVEHLTNRKINGLMLDRYFIYRNTIGWMD